MLTFCRIVLQPLTLFFPGGNVIHPDSEAIFYGILDIIAKPVFGFMLLFGHRNITPAELGMNIRAHDEPLTTREKHNGTHNGTSTV